jgi:hypothetical protein
MANDYIPRRDAEVLNWLRVFAGTISAAPSVYMLGPSDAAAIQRAVDEYAQAYALAKNPEFSTQVTVNEKDTARNSAEQICRQYASLIKPNAGVSDANKLAIGVRPLNRGRTPIHCPQSSPLLDILGAVPGKHVLCFHDTSTPESPAKPFGAIHLQLFIALGEQKIPDAEEARFYGTFTRGKFEVEFDHADDGKVATYFGRWASRRNQVGPWSSPVSMRVAA